MFRLSTTVLCNVIFVLLVKGQSTNNNECECVAFYLCNNGTIITNGENVIDIRLGNNPCGYLELCCKKADVKPEPTTIRNVLLPGCGKRNPDGVGFRITGSENNEAQFGETPWMVAILRKGPNESNFTYKCGGSLIHPRVVLTAAHCIVKDGKFRVRAGEWDTRTTDEMFPYQERDLISKVIHSEFHNKKLHNDIALGFLESSFDISAHINVVCLPPQNHVELSKNCFVTGWGKDKFEEVTLAQSILKRIEVPVVKQEKCQEAFRRTRLGRFFKLHKSFMCAGGEEGQDACTGDGGGPLVCPVDGQNDKYQQVGIVAWGIGCGNVRVPGAYVNVASFRNWIDDRMKEKNLNTATNNP